MKLRFIFLFIFLLLCQNFIWADEDVSNRPYVKSSDYGFYYVKCVPDEDRGSKGKTYVYKVEKDQDVLVTGHWVYIRIRNEEWFIQQEQKGITNLPVVIPTVPEAK